jgi:hypothetical protein
MRKHNAKPDRSAFGRPGAPASDFEAVVMELNQS